MFNFPFFLLESETGIIDVLFLMRFSWFIFFLLRIFLRATSYTCLCWRSNIEFLGSASAFFVTQTLRGLSRDGRTVIASIHQPSSEVFELFDHLYLLSGGKTVYFGKASDAYEVEVRQGLYLLFTLKDF